MKIQPFLPPKRTLMGPGPSDVSPRILEAMARPTIGHLDPLFVQMMDEMKQLLQYAFQTQSELTMPVSAPGSAGMETCFVNLIEAGDQVIVCSNGVFGGRMKENVTRVGAEAIMIEDEWGQPVDPNKVESALKKYPNAKALAFVHAETSTGARSDAKALAQLAQAHHTLTIVDTVTSLGGIEIDVDGWGLDAVYSGSQKCLSCTPGLSPITFSERAQHTLQNRKSPVQSWFLDLNLVMGYWGSNQKRSYHHTAPINALYGLHEALCILQEEGLQAAWQRHNHHHQALRAGLEALGLSFVVAPEYRLPQLNAVKIPDGIDDAKVRQHLLEQAGLEIGAGLGPMAGQIWRIGLMGHSAQEANVKLCLQALGDALGAQNPDFSSTVALTAANAQYES
ncbi:MAG: alanine--glyoxylate aminotransferase [Myxococcales bacterium]|nr:alanine--glyoxylate aminotransferase [Myxococcales bacterium]|tara:strand:+ start:668 stop:1849 length:1182 start_codon:yes stop_codon:yes gene_type:complete